VVGGKVLVLVSKMQGHNLKEVVIGAMDRSGQKERGELLEDE
jgi:hypothetical protein